MALKDSMLKLLRNRLVLGLLVVLVAIGAYLAFWSGAASALSYEAQPADRGNVETAVASSGSVSPLQTVVVGSEV